MAIIPDNPQLQTIYPAFVYCWRSLIDGKMYLGAHKHKGVNVRDSYICSQAEFKKIYLKAPENFEKLIVARGTVIEMFLLEHQILTWVDARNNPMYYNNSNGGGAHNVGHTLKSKAKMSAAWINRRLKPVSTETRAKIRASKQNISVESRAKMSVAASLAQIGKSHPHKGSPRSFKTNAKILTAWESNSRILERAEP